jgi:hypothetical protein
MFLVQNVGRIVELDYTGLQAFASVGDDFPVRVVRHMGAYYMVPDWSAHHDQGDEDDGEAKVLAAWMNQTPYNNGYVTIAGTKTYFNGELLP